MEPKSIKGLQNINSALFNMLLEVVATQRIQSEILCRLLSHADNKEIGERQELWIENVLKERDTVYAELLSLYGISQDEQITP